MENNDHANRKKNSCEYACGFHMEVTFVPHIRDAIFAIQVNRSVGIPKPALTERLGADGGGSKRQQERGERSAAIFWIATGALDQVRRPAKSVAERWRDKFDRGSGSNMKIMKILVVYQVCAI